MSKSCTCNACGHTGGEEFRQPDGKHLCPLCESSDVAIHLHLVGQVVTRGIVGAKGKRPGQRKPFIELLFGASLRRMDGKWMFKRRVIDRDSDKYEEVVKNPETGEVIHECREPLSKHQGHGSAKTKGETRVEEVGEGDERV